MAVFGWAGTMNLFIVPTLLFQAGAAILAVLGWRVTRPPVARALFAAAVAAWALALWLSGSASWHFRDGFPIAAPDLSYEESAGVEAALRFVGDFWLAALLGLAELWLFAWLWARRRARPGARPSGPSTSLPDA